MSTQTRKRRRFPKISPSAFQHPMDLRALDAVKRAKGVDLLIRKVIEYGYERYLYINNIADTVRITPRQVPLLHDMLVEACEILDVSVPELYLDQDPVVNAYTFGCEKPFIVLQSGLVDLLTEDELFSVIAHEVGHIKCGHVLYKMVAQFLKTAAEVIADMTFGFGKLITGPLLVAFYEWDRKAELSSDRASLLATQDADVVINTLMKLAGGSSKIMPQLDRDEFLRQAENYRELDASTLNQFYKLIQVIWRTHPFPALRAREIEEWSRSTEYQNILSGIYIREDMMPYGGNNYGTGSTGYGGYSPSGAPTAPTNPAPSGPTFTNCGNCSTKVEVNATFCHVCGATIIGAIAVVDKNNPKNPPSGYTPPTPPPPRADNRPRCRHCSAVLAPADQYCPSCGLNTRFDW
jgi:Zn-dependent protease with chaperone function/RNA polymerase subunit RPABC4/transcription elongation factor Spt4